jgi:hypothetical protein
MSPSGVLYYTCCTHDDRIEQAARIQLRRAVGELPITSVSLKPIEFGDDREVLSLPRAAESMHKQVLAGLRRMTTDYVYLVESDVLYSADHFTFTPPTDSIFYYNTNVWKVRSSDGHCIRTDDCQQVSGCCASRLLLLEHYERRMASINAEGFRQRNGYEPGTKLVSKGGYDDVLNNKSWVADTANLCLRHDKTLTGSKWSVADFRNKKYARGWQESTGVLSWGTIEGRFWDFITDVTNG